MNNDLDEIKKRMKKRKEPPLNDHHFSLLYHAMIKFMVVLLVIMLSLCFSKNKDVVSRIVENKTIQNMTVYFSQLVLDFLPDDTMKVSHNLNYKHLEGDDFKNDSNQVLSMTSGKVVEVKKDNVSILSNNNITIVYKNMTTIAVKKYDQIKTSNILGTYNKKLKILFYHYQKRITYDEYQNL